MTSLLLALALAIPAAGLPASAPVEGAGASPTAALPVLPGPAASAVPPAASPALAPASPAAAPASPAAAPAAADRLPAALASVLEPSRPATGDAPPFLAPSTPALVSALPAASALAALAAVGLLLSRRRGAGARRIVQVLETASLGPKRQLVVARLGGEILLLGCSESGIALLSSQAAADVEEAAGALLPRAPAAVPGALEPAGQAGAAPAGRSPATAPADASRILAAFAPLAAVPEPRDGDAEAAPARITSLWDRLRGRARAPAPSFEALLQENAEDQELRRKLAQGLAGKVA
jgi:flagellar protein FliO/FliZ